MKKNKNLLLILLGGILLAVAVGVLCIALRVAPSVNHAVRISELLQPVLEAQNQAMHVSVTAETGGTSVTAESDIFYITESDRPYLVLERNGKAVYIADHVLFLENGKAFKIADAMQTQAASYVGLLPQIKTLFEILQITAEETENQTSYNITVTGTQVNTLLAALSLGETLPIEGIEKLNLQITEKNGKLHSIVFSGGGKVNGKSVQLHATLSDLRILAPGDYPIPKAVRQSAATVNPEELFSLTEDLYRLVVALAPLADMESINGTLGLAVDCGLLQLDTQIELSDLKTSSNGRIDPEQLQALPEMLGWLCMEGEISCQRDGDSYTYTLALDQSSMAELSRMILPELAQYSGNLTNGSVTVILSAGKLASMSVSIEGKISAFIAQIPVAVAAEFIFD